MRKGLIPFEGKRIVIRGTFERYGFKKIEDSIEKKILLKNIYHGTRKVADYLWFNETYRFLDIGKIKQGDVIELEGRVRVYEKGYYNNRKNDYKLVYPTKIMKIV